MNYSHDNWSAILAHIGKPEELDTSARNAGALTRRREIRDAATLLRLGLAYGPGGMSLREVTAWAQLHDVATLSDVALLKRLRNAADWFGILAAQTLAVRAAVTGCTSGKRLRLVDGTAISAPGGGSAEWRLHMGYDPHTCQFTDFELTDSRDAERLDRFAQTADEIRIADRGFGSRPECIRSLAFGEADYIVRVHWRGLRWLTGFAPIFPDTCYHLTHYWLAAVDIPVASDNPVHYADAIRYNARTPLQGSLLPLTRLVWA